MRAFQDIVLWACLVFAIGCGEDGGAGGAHATGGAGGAQGHDLCAGRSCSQHGACAAETGACTCEPGYVGSSCQRCDSGYHRDASDACVPDVSCETADPCGAHGQCNDASGEVWCDCASGYTGETCEACYPGYHLEHDSCVLDSSCLASSCSAHGSCHLRAGAIHCSCEAGYAGASCEHCAPNYHRAADDSCVLDEKCADQPRYCGEHGSCRDDAGQLSCACDAGYAGEHCESCYTGYHPVAEGVCVLDEVCLPLTCSGHGACSVAEGRVSCDCDPGYAGIACQECAPEQHRDGSNQCVADEVCTPFSCNGHGACDAVAGVVACACETGYAGSSCSACYPGYHRDAELNCVRDDRCTPYSCGGHGACASAGDGVECVCDVGYAGPSCASCLAGFHRDSFDACVLDEVCAAESCGGHGSCDATAGSVRCSCEPGYLGFDCSACYPGYHADELGNCVLDVACETTTCPETASCDDSGQVPRCICMRGYVGSFCQWCAPDYQRALDDSCVPRESCDVDPGYCGDHGACDAASGWRRCVCDVGYVGERCGACASGYLPEGAACLPATTCTQTSCPADIATCDASTGLVVCRCIAGYAGAFCETCASGYHRDASDRCVPNSVCADLAAGYCGVHGACTDTSGAALCRCEEGYFGERCDDCYAAYYCSGRASACEVVADEPVCTCEPGYTGAQCELCALGFHREGTRCVVDVACEAAAECSGHGVCDAADGSPKCLCELGYTGATCSECAAGFHAVGANCAPDGTCSPEQCNRHGSCTELAGELAGELGCWCYDRYQGPNCADCAPGFEPLAEACGLCPEEPLTFDTFPAMPALPDTCIKRDPGPVWYQGAVFSSLSGDSQVLACAPSSLYAMTTKHLRLQAGNTTFADIIFDGPVRRVSFHFTPKERTALFEVLADGEWIETLSASRRTQGTFARTFERPLRRLSIRNGNANGTEIALDDLAFELAACP